MNRFSTLLLIALAACEAGDAGPDGTDAIPPLGPGDPLPGLHAEILAVEGGSRRGGTFQSGDRIRVRFRVTDDLGDPVPPAAWSRGQVYVSGPTFDYQRVIAAQTDVAARAVASGDGSFTYDFAAAIPDAYLEPFNYTGAFPVGVLAGQPLLSGTYTLALELRVDYELSDGSTASDVSNVVADFLLGDAVAVESRAVAAEANCNQCHVALSAHGGNRTNLVGCLLCHTAGAEDRNDPALGGGTPGVSVDFRVLIHRIHTGAHLPSVIGMGTDEDGNRDYTVPPRRYEVAGRSLHDFSDVALPLWPSASQPMPEDVEHAFLSPEDRAKEDLQRSGPTQCFACHGDPDGDGELEAPAQGDLIWSQPTRHACASCHDDWDPDKWYVANRQPMPPQPDDADCIRCHRVEGDPLAVRDAHLHPLLDPSRAEGLRFEIAAVREAGTNDGDGTIDEGERIGLEFTVTDRDGNAVDPALLTRFEVAISGPTENPNLLHVSAVAPAALSGPQPYALNVPERILLERLGISSMTTGDTFTTARTPHVDVAGAETAVLVRTGTGNASTLAAAVPQWQNWLDVAPGDGTMFARDDWIVIEDGVLGQEEYARLQLVDGDRLWLSSKATASYPFGVRIAHPESASVTVAVLDDTLVRDTDWSLVAATGEITELTEFGTGNVVLASYTSEFVVPPTFQGTLNESPDLGAAAGDWVGLPLVSGTYEVVLGAARRFDVDVLGQVTTYNDASPGAAAAFRVGDATELEQAMRIDSPAACARCHGELEFHGGGRRGWDGCIRCHGVAGAEDRPRYVAADAPDTTGVTIDFRTLLHAIHSGADHEVVGFGGAPHPDNFTVHTYETVGYPARGGTADCASCHGADNDAWIEPAPRDHPDGQPTPTLVWRAACGGCHDSRAALAHFGSNTSATGDETCAACHVAGSALGVDIVHTVR